MSSRVFCIRKATLKSPFAFWNGFCCKTGLSQGLCLKNNQKEEKRNWQAYMCTSQWIPPLWRPGTESIIFRATVKSSETHIHLFVRPQQLCSLTGIMIRSTWPVFSSNHTWSASRSRIFCTAAWLVNDFLALILAYSIIKCAAHCTLVGK